jgi:hypothetical protein
MKIAGYMKTILKSGTLGMSLGLLLLSSCATIPSRLPADVPMNKDAARGNALMVTLRLKSGEELLFAVDTGAPCTFLDKSLERKLGHRFESQRFTMNSWGRQQGCGLYLAPKFYLGDTPLKMTGDGILTTDLSFVALPGNSPIKGILGMNVLEHYCLQLDFEAGKMRFLNPNHLNVAELGNAFPISYLYENGLSHPIIQQRSLLGGPVTNVLVDTGLRVDGGVDAELFQREIVEQTRQEGNAVHGDVGRVWFAKCVWNGATYTNLLIGGIGGGFLEGSNGHVENLIGLGFLSRHLVTFDFPHRMMYLKQVRSGPLVDENTATAEAFLNDLKAKGKLPGWSGNDTGAIYLDVRNFQIEFDGRKNGDASDYHYQVGRPSKDSHWKLQKAWRTNQDGQTLEEYPVP